MINSDRWLREITVPLVAEEIEALCNVVVAGPSFQPGLGDGGTRDPQAKLCAPNCGESHPWHGGKPKKAKLDGGNPHDVSQENRQHGKFAPGAKQGDIGSAGGPTSIRGKMDQQPTGSPLDPATGIKPPPAPHEIHKQNMDYHQKAAKALQSMVKQHLDLGKLALSPEDRQNHIAQARQMKELAAKHVTEAGSHAQKMSEAMKQMVKQPGAPAADLGITGKPPTGASPIIPKVPTPTGAQNVQAAKGVIARQFPTKTPGQTPQTNTLKPAVQPVAAPKISHSYTNAQGQQVDVPASTKTGIESGPSVRREQERQEGLARQRPGQPMDQEKLRKAREDADWTRRQMGGGS